MTTQVVFVGLKVSDVNLFMIGNYQAQKRDDVIVDFKIYNLYNFQSVFLFIVLFCMFSSTFSSLQDYFFCLYTQSMPNKAPVNVANSPKPTSTDSCICPSGVINMPQKSIINPPTDSTAAVINWIFSFITNGFDCFFHQWQLHSFSAFFDIFAVDSNMFFDIFL